MSVKSLPGLLEVFDPRRLAHWGRHAMSLLVLIASVAALLLILVEQYGSVFHTAYARIAPSDGAAASSAGADAGATSAAEERRYRALAEFVAKRYRVSQDVAQDFVAIAHAAGHRIGLDPLLILAVMAVESRFNPIAESVVGAKGLMQIMPKYHADKLGEFGGAKAVFDPETNIRVGSQILKEYLSRTGNLSMALQMYAGALSDDEDVYTNRVLSEKQRLQQALRQNTRSRSMRTAAIERAAAGPLLVR